MFWKPNQTGQRKQKERTLAPKPHPKTAASEPSNSNRETKSFTHTAANPNRETESSTRTAAFSNRKPKLLETPQLQQNKPGSGLMIQPGDIIGPALIAKKQMFSPSISTHSPRSGSFRQSCQTRPRNRPQVRQTRRKRENPPLSFVAIKRRPDRLFS
jgi:hypothetical protein